MYNRIGEVRKGIFTYNLVKLNWLLLSINLIKNTYIQIYDKPSEMATHLEANKQFKFVFVEYRQRYS